MPKNSDKPGKSARRGSDRDDAVVGEARPARTGGETDALPAPDLAKPGADALPIEDPAELPTASPHGARLHALFDVAQAYGERSFENYARIRSLAETLRDEFCAWLSEEPGCVYLVPPEGRFSAKNYQSAAFSVAGKGYLPLKPISFGLAVRVSEDKDFMRLKVTCRKEGDLMFVRLERGAEIKVPQPVDEDALQPLFEAIYTHLVEFFQDRIDDYDNGRYGTQEIGFDIQRMTG
ncbi:MAG: hypothetical protein AAF311_11240 [Pseudomonadota bacterium]